MSGATTESEAIATCLLLIGDRVVLRASAPPETEYAMFELGEIELRASEPGRVREHGYQTTVERARSRLANFGLNSALAHEVADALQPVLSDTYARGMAVKRVARYLGPAELFQSDAYDGGERRYRGVFLDLAALARDLEIEHAGATFQALFLATILELEADDTAVLLSTDACTKSSKAGARTYKRPSFAPPERLLDALAELAQSSPRPKISDSLPRADVIAFLRTRADASFDEDARALYKSLEGRVTLRDIPARGPLASPELWALETRIETGDLDGLAEAVNDLELRHGRTPGTTYLRARVALALRLEPAKLIAERVSSLALSMTSFQELALLAAEAWLDAGDARRAMPYARDLIDATGVEEALLLRAQRILARAVGAAPASSKQTLVDAVQTGPQPSRPPPAPSADPQGTPTPVVVAPEAPSLDFWPPEALAPHIDLGTAGERESVLPPPSMPPLRPSALPPPPAQRTARGVPLPAPSRPSRLPPSLVPGRKLPGPSRVPPPSVRRSTPTVPMASPWRASSPDDADDAQEPTPPELSFSAPTPLQQETPVFVGPIPELDLDLPPPADPVEPPPALERPVERPRTESGASFTLELPGPTTPNAPSIAHTTDPPRASRRPRVGVVAVETRPPASFDPRVEPDTPPEPKGAPSAVVYEVPPPPKLRSTPAPARSIPPDQRVTIQQTSTSERPTPLRPPSGRPVDPSAPTEKPLPSEYARSAGSQRAVAPDPRDGAPLVGQYMHGASLPPYRRETSPPRLASAPLLPRVDSSTNELAEHLTLPPGLGDEQRPLDVLPTSVLEARVQFTLLSRELGLDYRLGRDIELRADVSGIEAMQSVLLETFPDHVVRSDTEAYELRRHGALLSEILARKLDAEWLDISPNELGYWVMIVPPDTRVWPFGRVARLVAMGHKERDLVSYFLELQSRAGRR